MQVCGLWEKDDALVGMKHFKISAWKQSINHPEDKNMVAFLSFEMQNSLDQLEKD